MLTWMNCYLNNFLKKILPDKAKHIWFLPVFISTMATAQHEVLIRDTVHISSVLLEDSTKYHSFKNLKDLNGRWVAYYDSEKQHKALEAAFKRGKLTGSEKQWYEGGELMSEKKCVNDTCTTDYYYKSGTLMQR